MACKTFEPKLDPYIDGVLAGSDLTEAEAHIRACRRCEKTVTQLQQARVLLTTAVAERVAAVDLSGLWESIEKNLDLGGVPETKSWLADARARAGRAFEATWQLKPMRVGAWAAAAAAAALLISYAQPEPQRVELAGRGGSYSRPVRIDSLEVAEGHTVSTWVRPRTKTRVIWVAGGDGGDGFSVTNATHAR